MKSPLPTRPHFMGGATCTKAGPSPRTILCAFARGDLEFWSVTEKLQMTAAWVSENGFEKTTKVRWNVAIAVLAGVSARRAKEKQ